MENDDVKFLVYSFNELDRISTARIFRVVQNEGKREVMPYEHLCRNFFTDVA